MSDVGGVVDSRFSYCVVTGSDGCKPMVLRFTVPGVPRGKGRPKFARVGRGVRAYTGAETMAYENRVLFAFKAAYPSREPIQGVCVLSLRAYFPASKSLKRGLRALAGAGLLRHGKKPDADNVLKAVLDGLNGVAYRDDCVVDIGGATRWVTLGEPRLEVEIEVL